MMASNYQRLLFYLGNHKGSDVTFQCCQTLFSFIPFLF